MSSEVCVLRFGPYNGKDGGACWKWGSAGGLSHWGHTFEAECGILDLPLFLLLPDHEVSLPPVSVLRVPKQRTRSVLDGPSRKLNRG